MNRISDTCICHIWKAHLYIKNSIRKTHQYFQICSQVINHVNDGLQINILKTSCIPIIEVNVVRSHKLMYRENLYIAVLDHHS